MTSEPEAIGVVLGSRESSPLEFWVGIQEGGELRLDDLVVVASPSAFGEIRFYGVVDQVNKLLEGTQYDSDTFLASQHLIPTNRAYVAHISVTRVDPEHYLPPEPGAAVFLAQGESLDRALYFDQMKERLPVGLLQNGAPAWLNLKFLDGRAGGHVNISGISGVAAKTSYASFLLYSIFKSGVVKDSASTRALIFNVKGEDLLFLDKNNAEMSMAHPEAAQEYQTLGLRPGPFTSVEFTAPPVTTGALAPAVDSRRVGVQPYHWDLAQFANEGLLPFLFADRGAMTNLGFLIDQVTSQLARVGANQKGPGLKVEDWNGGSLAGNDFASLGKTELKSFSDLVAYIEYKLLGAEDDPAQESKGDPRWMARQQTGTLLAFCRRLRSAASAAAHLIRGDQIGHPPDPLGGNSQVTVVDIHQLPATAQMFVVGSLLKKVFSAKESGRAGRVYVVLDELNKYAPRDDEGPIKDLLLDIAERGRSLGVILIGAEQTASEVERRVVANAAIRVVGRLDAGEADHPSYRYLPPVLQRRSLLLAPGSVIIQQPELPTPLVINFPFPAWATNAREAVEDNSPATLKQEFDL